MSVTVEKKGVSIKGDCRSGWLQKQWNPFKLICTFPLASVLSEAILWQPKTSCNVFLGVMLNANSNSSASESNRFMISFFFNQYLLQCCKNRQNKLSNNFILIYDKPSTANGYKITTFSVTTLHLYCPLNYISTLKSFFLVYLAP